MAKDGITVQLSIKELHELLCPDCKVKLRELVKSKVTEQMVDKVLET